MDSSDSLLKDFLIDAGLLSRGQLEALRPAEGQPLSRALIEGGVLSEEEVRRATAHALGIPFVILEPGDIDEQALMLLPEPLCRTHSLAAYRTAGGKLEVAALELADLEALEPLRSQLPFAIAPRLTTRESMRRALLSYQKLLRGKFGEALQRTDDPHRLLTTLLRHARLQRAGEIQLESRANGLRVAYRHGTAVREAMLLPAAARGVVGAIRSLANLPSRTLPQEGKFTADLGSGVTLAVRVSSIPTVEGDKLVLRLLEEEGKGYSLESLGLHGAGAEALRAAVHGKGGMVLLAGPRGSGRTTLLYTLFDMAYAPERVLASVEDEVATRLPYAAQTAVDGAAGLTMAAALRAALRQDPDVVMLDSIADRDSAALALAAAARGVLVLASIEARDAHEGLERLRTLGASEADLAAVSLVVGTGLLPRLCDKQTRSTQALERRRLEPLEPHADFAKVLAALKEEERVPRELAWKDVGYAMVTGCSECQHGYRGAVGIFDIKPQAAARRASEEPLLNLFEDALYKAASGLTGIADVLRLAEERSRQEEL